MRKLSPGEVSNLATVTELVNGRKGTRILIYLMPKPKLLAILLPVSCQLSLFPTSKSSTKAPHYDLHMTNTQKIKAEFKIPNSFIQEAATENKEWKIQTEPPPFILILASQSSTRRVSLNLGWPFHGPLPCSWHCLTSLCVFLLKINEPLNYKKMDREESHWLGCSRAHTHWASLKP